MTRGVKLAAKAGNPPGGKAPYGYRRQRRTERVEDARGRMKVRVVVTQEPDPQTAPIVRQIFDDLDRGVPVSEVTRTLNESGVPSPTGQAGAWTRWRIRDIALNVAYAGWRIHRRLGRNGDGRGTRYDAGWEPLVSPELFARVGERLAQHQNVAVRPGRQQHLLSYLATCECGTPLVVRAGRYYVCKVGCCGVRKDDLDELVAATIVEALASDEVYTSLRTRHEVSNPQAQAARNEQAKLTERLRDYRQRMRRGTMDPDDFEAIAADLRQDIAGAWEARCHPGVATVVVHPAGHRRGVPIADRVSITRRYRAPNRRSLRPPKLIATVLRASVGTRCT